MSTTMLNLDRESLIHSLEKVAQAQENNAKELRDLVQGIKDYNGDFADSYLVDNVTRVLFSAFNTGNQTGYANSAVNAAARLVHKKG